MNGCHNIDAVWLARKKSKDSLQAETLGSVDSRTRRGQDEEMESESMFGLLGIVMLRERERELLFFKKVEANR